MSSMRIKVINEAFAKMDKTGDGQINADDLKVYLFIASVFGTTFINIFVVVSLQGVYNVKKHPQYLNGQLTEEEILKKFLNNFELYGNQDGTVCSYFFIITETYVDINDVDFVTGVKR